MWTTYCAVGWSVDHPSDANVPPFPGHLSTETTVGRSVDHLSDVNVLPFQDGLLCTETTSDLVFDCSL